MKRSILVVGLLAALLTTAFGQRDFLQTKIPFEFVAGGKTFPAGNYDFSASNNLIHVKNHDTGAKVAVKFLTRIAADKTASGKGRIAFDVREGKHFVEVIWPEGGDGYLMGTVKGEHSHDIVKPQ